MRQSTFSRSSSSPKTSRIAIVSPNARTNSGPSSRSGTERTLRASVSRDAQSRRSDSWSTTMQRRPGRSVHMKRS